MTDYSSATAPVSEVLAVPDRVLLGPGPSMVSPRVLQAMMQNMIGYLDPDYVLMLEDVSGLLGEVFQTGNAATMALSGTGSAGMEAGLSSLLEPGDTVIGVSPRYSHPAVVRAVAHARARFTESCVKTA